jgi:hypothetical protein
MVIGTQTGIPCTTTSIVCSNKLGCTPGVCADFILKRHDTKPPFKVSVEDCDGPLDLTDGTSTQVDPNLVLEVNMWATGKLKAAIDNFDTYFALADNIGFEQVMVGDIIVMDRVRLPEHMLVTAFDETNYLIQVQRGYNGTQATAWKKGTSLRIFRAMNKPASIELVFDDIIQTDGLTLEDQLSETFLVVEWDANMACLPGCYWVEFKLLRMTEAVMSILAVTAGTSITPSFTPSTFSATNFGCTLGEGVEYVRRFPSDKEGFLIQIVDSPTMELV